LIPERKKDRKTGLIWFASRLEDIAVRLEAIVTRVEAIAIRNKDKPKERKK